MSLAADRWEKEPLPERTLSRFSGDHPPDTAVSLTTGVCRRTAGKNSPCASVHSHASAGTVRLTRQFPSTYEPGSGPLGKTALARAYTPTLQRVLSRSSGPLWLVFGISCIFLLIAPMSCWYWRRYGLARRPRLRWCFTLWNASRFGIRPHVGIVIGSSCWQIRVPAHLGLFNQGHQV